MGDAEGAEVEWLKPLGLLVGGWGRAPLHRCIWI